MRVEAYETYVVASVNGASTPKYITDRFRKDASGTAVKLELDDRWSSERTLEIVDKNGKALTFSSINSRSILSVAKSKDGSYTKVVNSSQQLSSMEVRQIEDNKITLGTTEYETNWYFQQYSGSMPQFERGDKIIAYLDKNNKITWIEISPTNYDIGYIMDAYIDNTSMKNELIIKIYTGSTSIAVTTTKNTKVTMYDEALGEQNGQPVKDLSSDEILKRLKKQASIINEGKPNKVISTAGASQPIRYSVSDGKLTSLLAIKLDENTKYTQETGSYTYMTAPVSSFLTGSGETISIPTSNATIMFVPDNRTGWGVSGYRSGSLSSVSDKLKVGMPYNVDSFYLPASDGETLERRVFVIYNESIDAKPSFTSENIVVSELKEVVGGGAGTTYEITPFSGTGSKSVYTLYSRGDINAYVLDENFERKKDEKGSYIRRMVEVGDVIRFGYYPNGQVAEIELVFDINKDLSERKAIAKESNGRTIALSDVNLDAARISYFGRVGLITDIREESCIMMLNEGNTPQQSSLYINKNHENVTVYLYNPENKKTPIQLSNMSQVYPGDMIFVQQSANLYTKYIYVVRYENSLVDQVNIQDNSQENLADKSDTELVPPVEDNTKPSEEAALPAEPSDSEKEQQNEPTLTPEEEQKTEDAGQNGESDLVAPEDLSLPEAILPSTEDTQETIVEPEV